MSAKNAWRVGLAVLLATVAAAATTTSAAADAAFRLDPDVANNTVTGSAADWVFDANGSRWGAVFVHPWQAGDVDLSVSRNGTVLGRSELAENRMDFVALDFHTLPQGTYQARTWNYRLQPAHQTIFRTSSGALAPRAFGSGMLSTPATNSANWSLLGSIFDVTLAAGRDYILSAETPGGLFLMNELAYPVFGAGGAVIRIDVNSAPSRVQAVASLRDDETCVRYRNWGSQPATLGLAIIFRDSLAPEPARRRFNIVVATPGQADSTGCRWVNPDVT